MVLLAANFNKIIGFSIYNIFLTGRLWLKGMNVSALCTLEQREKLIDHEETASSVFPWPLKLLHICTELKVIISN